MCCLATNPPQWCASFKGEEKHVLCDQHRVLLSGVGGYWSISIAGELDIDCWLLDDGWLLFGIGRSLRAVDVVGEIVDVSQSNFCVMSKADTEIESLPRVFLRHLMRRIPHSPIQQAFSPIRSSTHHGGLSATLLLSSLCSLLRSATSNRRLLL